MTPEEVLALMRQALADGFKAEQRGDFANADRLCKRAADHLENALAGELDHE